ncbi:hypothetical protein [Pseudolactococcus yaeyamensis]
MVNILKKIDKVIYGFYTVISVVIFMNLWIFHKFENDHYLLIIWLVSSIGTIFQVRNAEKWPFKIFSLINLSLAILTLINTMIVRVMP